MFITIITDASHCPNTSAGGYGFWIASKRGKRAGGGSFRNKIRDSTTAEAMAIVNALHVGLQTGLLQEADNLLVQTDSKNAIKAFQKRHSRIDDLNHVVSIYLKIIEDNNFSVEFRHVRGHTGKKDARSITNSLCDKRAKQGMRIARKKFNKQQEHINE